MDSNFIKKTLFLNVKKAHNKHFDKWLVQLKQNRELYKEIKVIREHLEGVFTDSHFDKSRAKAKIIEKIQARKHFIKRQKPRLWIPAFASFLLLIGLGFSSIYLYTQDIRYEIVHSTGNINRETK